MISNKPPKSVFRHDPISLKLNREARKNLVRHLSFGGRSTVRKELGIAIPNGNVMGLTRFPPT